MISISTTTTAFIERWQTLIGSALGPFLAITLSAIGFLIKGLFQRRNDRKEAIRRAEIAFSQTLNDLSLSIKEWREFIKRVKILIEEVKSTNDPRVFVLNYTNSPITTTIQFDTGLTKMKFGSYYLHNKILIIDHTIRWANRTFEQFKVEFENLLRRNEAFAEKMPPMNQQKSHSENLAGFSNIVENLLDSMEKEKIKEIFQAKIYNLKLMKNYHRALWKHEGISFKYFKDKKAIEDYKGNMKAIYRIDKLMEKEAEELIPEAVADLPAGHIP